MTPAEAEALGRRWQAAGGFIVGGMLLRDDFGRVTRQATEVAATSTMWWPDFRDPATRGAALQVVRERWASPAVHVRQRGTIILPSGEHLPAWEVCDLYLSHEAAKRLGIKAGPVGCSGHASEAEALVFALETAPVSR